MSRSHKIAAFFKGIIIAFAIVLVIEGGYLLYQNGFISIDILQMSNVGASTNTPTGDMEGDDSLKLQGDIAEPVNTGEDLTFDASTYPYRELLNENQQAIYNQIYTNALEYNTETFTLAASVDSDELSEAINAVYNDHPELFWLNTSYKYGCDKSGNVVQVQLSYGISSSDLATAKTNFDNAIATIVSGASAYSSDIEKELYVHDAICDLTTYDTDSSLNQSAYSALVMGSTVCAGYARAFQVVCQELGMTCYYLTGTADGGDHAWNIIAVDGDFYNVDVTWDDSISESYGSSVYTYFNLTDSAIGVDHTRGTFSSKLPACTATAMSYTNVYGSTVEIDDITNNGGGQITDGNFTISEPPEPVIDWKNPKGDATSNDNNNPPGEMGPEGDTRQDDMGMQRGPGF